ncbi:MAG TPA: Asp-tRNA(Asn)/Glu-tRNA(Gln) amidotransferase subunit GatA [Oligoflexia bacterium]|nr:Asp-tRNA(Asn)/Glu-tRNA(Gln) amidotransferase subunit GatA [Oligoflexia bacterium]HMP49717.1 Asp-tRNA(Asn)/Glu-tRNA(Gln) amidotransferase subunit GatA [Oligoflexia bacterium]
MTEELTSLSACEMRENLLAGSIKAKDLVNAHFSRIEETSHLNSFITIAKDTALKEADRADEVLKSKGQDSPFFTGIPVAIKDQLLTAGLRTTCGSKMLDNFIAPYDCTAVSRLKEAGAIIVGKTNQDEFAMGSSNEFSYYGPVQNPWDIKRVPGGSSGGSAAAVSSGQSPLALGTDTGGSIRQPAGLCGVVGLKPTYGRVSRYGAVAFASSLDQIGPFARTVADVAVALQAIAGEDERDSTSMKVTVPDYLSQLQTWKEKDLSGLRIGIPKEYLSLGMEDEQQKIFNEAVDLCRSRGAEIKEISLPHSQYALAAYYITAPAEAASNLARFDGIRYGYRASEFTSLGDLYRKTRAEGFGAEVKRRIMIGSFVLSAGYFDAYYKKAQQVRTLIINDFKAAFVNFCDLILTPVSPTVAFPLGSKTDDPLTMYLADIFTVPVNLAGLPAISLPFRRSKEGLPVGIQLITPSFSEGLLLGVSSVIEREAGFPVKEKTVGKLKDS